MKLRKVTEELSNAKNALIYVISIRGRKRSPDLEPVISKSCNHAMEYALYVLRDRFPLGEPAIARSARNVIDYSKHILKGRFPLGEKALGKPYCSMYLKIYIKEILRERSELIEEILIKRKDVKLSVDYSLYCLRGRFEKAENYIIKSPEQNKIYIHYLQLLRKTTT